VCGEKVLELSNLQTFSEEILLTEYTALYYLDQNGEQGAEKF